MKTKLLSITTLFLTVIILLTSCAADELWGGATYLADTTVGVGANTVSVEIEAGGKSITLTVKTEKETLGEALYELGIINDPTFFDTANGIKADWYKDSAYWAFYKGDEYMMHGAGDESISGGELYRLVYTK